MKIHNTEMDIKTAGLLLFLADNTDSKGVVKMGIREISRRIGESPMWVSRHIKDLCEANIIQSAPIQKCVTENIAASKIIKCCVTVSYGMIQKSKVVQNIDTELFDKIWKMYRRDGNKGNKTSAYKNYLNLSKQDKEDMEKYIPYFMAFTLPKFRPMMSKFIKDKYWHNPREFNGRVIPTDRYRIADIEAFKEWFNKEVMGTDIPKVAEVTPERHVNLNICYTLYPKLMSKAMRIVKENEFYLKGAKDGWLTFDYIFNPVHLIEICEKGENDD